MTRPLALSCPLCGGAVDPPADRRQVTCGYCGRALHYGGEDFIARYWLGEGLPDATLQERFFELLRTPLAPSDLRRQAVVLHKRRLFFPLYLVSGTRGGVLKTVKERIVQQARSPSMADFYREEGLGAKTAEAVFSARTRVEASPDARVVLGDFLYVYSAAAAEGWDFDAAYLQDLGKQRIEEAVPARLSRLAEKGEVIEATLPVARMLEKGVASWQAGGNGGPELLETSVRILYVPLVEVAFRHGEQVSRVLFEALGGRPLSGSLPFRRDWATLLGIPAAGLMGLLLGKAARVMFSIGEVSRGTAEEAATTWVFFALFATVVLGLGLQALWLLLRAPLEVQLLTGGGGKLVLTQDPADSPAAPLQRLVLRALKEFVSGRRP